MDINGKTALILGGAGLVGRAVCLDLIEEGAATLLVGGLTEAEAYIGIAELRRMKPGAAVDLIPFWGNVFVRESLAHKSPAELRLPEVRTRLLADALEEMTPDVFDSSHLVQLVLGKSPMAPGKRPDVVIDAVNTATALAYGGLYETIGRVMRKRRDGDASDMQADVDDLLAASAIPWLVRHVQLISQAMIEARTRVYVKIGTTGTGGMGLNIPYTHGEEKPSRVLLSKSALAGAHSMLLMLLARTPGAPAVKEIKPAAAITWKRIAYGPIVHRRAPIALYDCRPDQGKTLDSGATFALDHAGEALGGKLESVFIDTGENGLFSVAEYTAITALGQMEAVTPEEIAIVVVREIRGATTGKDVVAALDSTIMGPSYRAGVLRRHAIDEARALAEKHGVPSIAFEILGPPRLSKLLYEAELLRRAYGTLEAVAADDPAAVAARLEDAVAREDDVRRAALSVGIPILRRDGRTLLCADRGHAQHRWERAGWTVDDEAIERYAHAEWIDLRPTNGTHWHARATAILAQTADETASGITGSGLDRRFQAQSFDIGEVAAWIFIHEDGGRRV